MKHVICCLVLLFVSQFALAEDQTAPGSQQESAADANADANANADTSAEESSMFDLDFSIGEDLRKWVDDLDLHYDWDLFDGKGFTPRYAYLDDENFIGNAHYLGVGYYHKAGAESEGVTLRGAFGARGEKINFAYTNSFSFMAVDIGLSYYFLDDGNRPELEYEELLGLELGLRFWVIQFVGVHTESTSFITLAYGF